MNGDAAHNEACARIAARFPRGWLRCYVGAKIRNDPAFPAIFQLLRDSPLPVFDLGCGVGLLAAYLRERGCVQPVIGVDCDRRKLAYARNVARDARYEDVDFRDADVGDCLDEFGGNVALLDVVHYLRRDKQSRLLRRVAAHVPPAGVVAIRDAPRERTARFAATYVAEKFAQAISWNVSAPLAFPTSASLHAAFASDEFDSESKPLWGRTPFNNRLFIFRRRPAAVATVAG